MRSSLLGMAALIALAGPAVSADMPVPIGQGPHWLLPAWSWTSCFIGGHGGGLFAQSTEWIVRTPGGAFFGESLGDHAVDGGLGGVQAGCDYQLAGGFVVGIQGDYSFADVAGRHDSAREFGVAYHSNVKSLASVTGRIGYAWDRVLGYVKGGAAWERDDYWATTLVLGTAYAARETRSGWAVGIGGEYAFTDFLSGFVEFSYFDFGSREIGFSPRVVGLRPASVEIEETASVVRVGLNLRFGAYAISVAASD
jgi:outer membrane immunogenic protein